MPTLRIVSAVSASLLLVIVAGAGPARASHAVATSPFQGYYLEPALGALVVHVIVDPGAPVQDVVLWSPDCQFAPAEEIWPGEWASAATPPTCQSATATIVLEGSDEPATEMSCPFVGLEGAVLSGSSHADSYDPLAGPYSSATAGDEGHVCSNGEVRLNGSARVRGDVRLGPDGRFRANGKAGISGDVEYVGASHELAPVALPDVVDNDAIPFSARGRYPVDRRGGFSLSSHDSVELEPGTYLFSKFSLSGGASVGINGPTAIYVTGDFKASGGTLVNHRGVPSDLRIFTTGRKVDLSGQAELYALVHAPDAEIMRTGGSEFFGALAGRLLKLSGHGAVHGVGAGHAGPQTFHVELDWSLVPF